MDVGMDLALDRVPTTVPSIHAHEAQALLVQRLRAENPETEQFELPEESVYLPLRISPSHSFHGKKTQKCRGVCQAVSWQPINQNKTSGPTSSTTMVEKQDR